MKMVHGLKTLLLTLSLFFCLDAFSKTLQVDTIVPSVTNGDMTISRNGTGDILLGVNSGFIKLVSGVLTEQAFIDVTTDITGVLPVANGGTNSSTALNNDFVMISSSGSIVEDSAVSTTELSYLDGVTSAIQTQIDAVSGFTTVTKTTTATLATTSEDNVLADASGGDFTITLPAASGNSGLTYKITSISTGTVTIEGNASETIGGELNVVMASKDDSIIISTDGTSWYYLSDDVVYAAKYTTNQGQTLNSTLSAVTFEDLVRDTHGIYSGTTITIPIDGWYLIVVHIRTTSVSWSSGDAINLSLEVDSVNEVVLKGEISPTAGTYVKEPFIVNLEYYAKGTVIDVECQSTVTTADESNPRGSYFSIQRVK